MGDSKWALACENRVGGGSTAIVGIFSIIPQGSVEKSRQRRSRHFPVLTYDAYAPRVKTAAALLDGLF